MMEENTLPGAEKDDIQEEPKDWTPFVGWVFLSLS